MFSPKALLTSAAAVAICLVTLGAYFHPRRTNTPGVVAFTATVETKMYDRSGAFKSMDVTVDAVREDGAHVFLRESINGSPVGVKSVTDPNSATRIVVDPATESLTTYHLSKEEVSQLRNIPVDCIGAEHNSILGFDVYKSTTTTSDEVGQLQVESWLAPALNCYPLRNVAILAKKDGSKRRNESQAISVTKGTPDANLFNIPVSYAERPPSQVLAEAARRKNSGQTPNAEWSSKIEDQVYSEHQGAKP
jgi:hypothetical protein